MSIVKKKMAPKLTPQYIEQQKLLAVKVDSLASEMGIQWCLLDTEVRCQVQATLAQAVAQADLAMFTHGLARSQDKIADSLQRLATQGSEVKLSPSIKQHCTAVAEDFVRGKHEMEVLEDLLPAEWTGTASELLEIMRGNPGTTVVDTVERLGRRLTELSRAFPECVRQLRSNSRGDWQIRHRLKG
jgi:hypothetical protein